MQAHEIVQLHPAAQVAALVMMGVTAVALCWVVVTFIRKTM